MHFILDYTLKVAYGPYLGTIWIVLNCLLERDLPNPRGDERMQGIVGCCQVTFQNVFPVWIFCFQKWTIWHLIFVRLNSPFSAGVFL